RQFLLIQIARQEGARTVPPSAVLPQLQWLVGHRLRQLQGCGVLLAVAGLIGGCEGSARRRQGGYGGGRFRWWAMGAFSVIVELGGVAGLLLWPWPLAWWIMPMLLASVSGVSLYSLCLGRPYVA